MGMWHLFVVDDDAITDQIRRAVLEPHEPLAYENAWKHWDSSWRDVRFDLVRRADGRLVSHPSATPLFDLAWSEVRDADALVTVADALYDRFGQRAFAGSRRAPFGPVLHAYGPDRCAVLPGVLGNVVADAAEIARIAPRVAVTFDLSDLEEREIRRRAEAWYAGTGEGRPDDPTEEITALPRHVARAAATGRGLIAITAAA